MLDGVTLHPHISLYHVPLTEEILPTVTDALKSVAATTAPFPLEHDTYYSDQGVWIGVPYLVDKGILDLHTAVITAVKGNRVIEDDIQHRANWAERSHSEQKNLEDCGWADVYTRYFPHITFTKLREPREDVLTHLPHREFSFKADRIGLFELGENGTCVRLIADFQLKGNT